MLEAPPVVLGALLVIQGAVLPAVLGAVLPVEEDLVEEVVLGIGCRIYGYTDVAPILDGRSKCPYCSGISSRQCK